ncbi:MAG: GTPase Era [Flavobacteriales bacterium]|nr:GTPase Era [Flavobacteriales bacterium]|tara:strand:+ start:55 stop:930 length:876 start_codon:yes stop_codon:yes gene_type:complete
MHKAGFVTILGNPNVGKSTLMNELMGERLSIITQKAQTTRHRILGVVSEEDYQIVFSDTPGVINPHHNLHEAMMNFVNTSLEDADVILYMVDCSKEDLKDVKFLEKINSFQTPIILIINKIDLIDQAEVTSLIDYWSNKILNTTILPISALKKFNIDRIKEEIIGLLPESPAYFPKDTLTDKSERFIVSEIVREKILERYKQEIPYSVEVVVNSFKDKDKVIVIDATIYVERESQKAIILGKKGVAINAVGTSARKTMQNFFKKKIFLGLFVKVAKDWRSKKTQLKKFGYN